MLIQGYPVAVSLDSDPSFKDRFRYWSGASGRKYIFSVFELECCPALPGAIYVAVRRAGHLRVALEVGRFQSFWDRVTGTAQKRRLARLGANELHVHLLGKTPAETARVFGDLRDGFADRTLPEHSAARFNRAPEAWSAELQ